MAEEKKNLEETMPPACSKGKCCCGRLFCLKGLATTWKVLSILALILTVVAMVFAWLESSAAQAAGYNVTLFDKILTTVIYGVNGLVVALLFITISRVLKTLRKIKHAVEHK